MPLLLQGTGLDFSVPPCCPGLELHGASLVSPRFCSGGGWVILDSYPSAITHGTTAWPHSLSLVFFYDMAALSDTLRIARS